MQPHIFLPDPSWLVVALAALLLLDAMMSVKPPAFIAHCLRGVQFPQQWWWVLIVVKLLAAAGLIVGIWVPGVGPTANVGVVAYFVCAAVAHVRAKFLGREFWINCLGFLASAVVVLVVAFIV